MLASNLAQLAKLKSRFDGAAAAVRFAIKPSLKAEADKIVAEMQRLAPKDTGKLAASIVATPAGEATPENALGATRTVEDGHVAITAGDREAFWATFVEFGTSKAHAQPFFYPACRALKSGVAPSLKKAALGAVKASR